MLDMEIIADQISRAFRGESWHGPSVREVLAGVSAEDAAAHPIPGAHSIWEIVLHLIGGYNLVLRRRESQGTLEQLNQRLLSAVRAFPVQRLSEELGSEYPAYIQFCGAPQHDLYHAGQIVILKKALSASREAA